MISPLQKTVKPSFENPQEAACELLLRLSVVSGGIALAGSLARLFSTGWLPVMGLHIGLYLALWAVVLNRRRLSVKQTAFLLISFFLFIAFGAQLQFGVYSIGAVFVIGACILTSTFFDTRSSLLVFCGSLTVFTLLFVFRDAGGGAQPVDLFEYQTHLTSLINQVLGMFLAAFSPIIANQSLQRSLREAQSELQQHATHLRAVIDAMPTPCVFVDAKGQVTFLNNAFAKTFGYSADDIRNREEFAARTLPDLDYRKQILSEFDAGLERLRRLGGRSTSLECRLRCKDGRFLQVVAGAAVIHVDGWVERVFTFFDITDLREAQRAQDDTAQSLSNLVSSASDPILTIDREGTIVHCNESTNSVFGYAGGALVGRSLDAIVPEHVAGQHRAWVDRFFTSQGTSRAMAGLRTVEGRRADGKALSLQISLSRSQQLDGQFATAIIRDVGPLAEAQRKLDKAFAQLRIALSAARGGAWECALTEGLLLYSSEWYEMTGFEPGSLSPQIKDALDLVHPDDRELMAKRFGDYAKGRTKSFVSEHRMRFADGAYHWVVDSANFTEFGADGQPTRMLGINIDISESRALREQLVQSEKLSALGQLAGGMAHDVNNMLAVILGNAEMIARDADSGSRIQSMASRIVSSATSGAQLITRMLAFSRKSAIQPANLDLGRAVADIVTTMQRTLGGRIEIRVTPCDETVWVNVDRAMLESCLINLSVNARDAMPDGGVLHFGLTCEDRSDDDGEGHWAVLRVTDAGMGMSEEVRKRVFEPFFTTKPMGGGTGLGLSMVYGFVKQSGGTIEVESAPGRGSTFIIRLPRIQAAGSPEGERRLALRPVIVQTVLVVDDNELVRLTLKEQLEGIGCRVLEAGSVEDAKICIERDPSAISFVLADLDLGPGLSGIDLARWVKERGYDYPGAIASGFLNLPEAKASELQWARITKPVELAQLAALLRRGGAAARGVH